VKDIALYLASAGFCLGVVAVIATIADRRHRRRR
jgi:hypothetical protein